MNVNPVVNSDDEMDIIPLFDDLDGIDDEEHDSVICQVDSQSLDGFDENYMYISGDNTVEGVRRLNTSSSSLEEDDIFAMDMDDTVTDAYQDQALSKSGDFLEEYDVSSMEPAPDTDISSDEESDKEGAPSPNYAHTLFGHTPRIVTIVITETEEESDEEELAARLQLKLLMMIVQAKLSIWDGFINDKHNPDNDDPARPGCDS